MNLIRETDQMGREVWIPAFPKRIVSLVPSQTELLYDLGLEQRVVGQTIFCIHPRSHFKSAVKIGGTKRLQIEKIRSLDPDLIIGNKEENERSQIEELEKDFPVWMSDIRTPAEAIQMILSIGRITQTKNSAEALSNRINRLIEQCTGIVTARQKAIYLIWKTPWMAAGHETYIHEMMKIAGYENLIEGRYPELSIPQITALKPEKILLSSEPYPFQAEHVQELKQYLPFSDIALVDGELFSWYGSRMIHALEFFLRSKK